METTKIQILDFSDYLINLFAYRGEPLTHKKLQKLLYYVQAWHLVYFDGIAIFDDIPKAWRHGPVYPNVYSQYKQNGFDFIIPQKDISLEDLNLQLAEFKLSAEQNNYIESVVNYYGSKNAIELELLSHAELPWIEARKGLSNFERGNNDISLESMNHYYNKLQKR